MKVINLVEEGRFGGPQKRIVEVAKGLKSYGIETTVVLPKYESETFQKLLKENNISFHTLPLHRLTKYPLHLLQYGFFFLYEIFILVKLFKKLKPAVVHCNGSWQVKGVIAAKISGVRSVWHMNDTHFQGMVMKLFQTIARFFADDFIGASNRALNHYRPEIIPNDQNIIQAPIHTNSFDPDIIVPSSDLSNDQINVLTVGHINEIKGYPTLIQAVHLVNKQLPSDLKVHFYAVGKLLDNLKSFTDNLMAEKEKLGIDNLTFLGERRDIKELLAAADMYVCPSDFEASPISVWEAMSMRQAIACTDVGDVTEIFAIRNSGIVVPTKKPEALAAAIVKLLKDKNLRKELGEKARQTAKDTLDLSVCIRKHAELYQRMANVKIINETTASI